MIQGKTVLRAFDDSVDSAIFKKATLFPFEFAVGIGHPIELHVLAFQRGQTNHGFFG
jgi:hypothetical protein